MRARDLSRQAHGFLLRAIQKRAWGESVALDSFDPSDLVEELRPAISEAIGAVGDRAGAASIMLNLYRRYAGSDLGAISMLFRASRWHDSDAFRVACTRTVQQSGPEAIELLLEALADVTDEEAVVDYLFDMCRVATNEIADPAMRMNVLRTACRQALDATEDRDLAEVLREGLDLAAQRDQRRAVETLFDYYHREAAIEVADDPWLLLDGLIDSLRTAHDVDASGEATLKRLKQTLREAVAEEGADQLGMPTSITWKTAARPGEWRMPRHSLRRTVPLFRQSPTSSG